MQGLNPTEEEQKVLELLYSGTMPNDLLAFEIIKNSAKIQPYLGALVCVAMMTEDQSLANNILTYLQPSLSQRQIELIKYCIQRIGYKSILLGNNNPGFLLFDAVHIYYANFRRTGSSIVDFLSLDDGTHPDRASVFKVWMKSQLERIRREVFIPGLLAEELEEYIRDVFPQIQNSRYLNLRLRVTGLKSECIPDVILTHPYRTVYINSHPSQQTFPNYIFKLIETESLALDLFPNWEIPKNWSAMKKLSEINFSGMGHVFNDFDFIDTLPKLRKLGIPGHEIQSPNVLLRKKAVPLTSHPNFKDRAGYTIGVAYNQPFVLPNKEMLSIAGALGKSILSQAEKEYFFKKITGVKRLKDLKFTDRDELIALMNVSHTRLRSVVQAKLNELCNQSVGTPSLNEKSLLYIAGKPERSKTEIKKKLKELHISLASKPTELITHLVVCKSPKEYKELKDKNLVLVSEQALYQIFSEDAPGFIEEAVISGDTGVSDNIQQLIYSDEITNVNLGLEMLKNGGVPDELVEALLVVFKTCPDSKARGLAKKLLLRNAPTELLPLINDSQRFTNLHQKVKAQEINKKLEKIARTTSRDLAAKMSLLLHGRFKKGLRYILYHFKKPCAERTLALRAMMEGTHFDFASGLGFTTWHGKDPETIAFFNMKAPAKFPIDVVEHVPLIETANFHNCKFASLPINFGNMKDLKKLDLSYNFLSSIPKSVEKMTQLEHLDLRMNKFKTFPSTLLRLPNLKTLDLRHNRLDHEFVPVEIDNEVRNALKNCEILV